ncbi:fibroblast growth factor 1-like [Euwallacea fornicatus]|uniref:fibroblast growth factor 1-like n=1 Tax=Euwallacea fornicatus TaxID=995702 RepID=UPI00338EDE1E
MSKFNKHSDFADESDSSSDNDSDSASSEEHISRDALDDGPGTSRKRRNIYWCDVGEKSSSSQSQFPMIRKIIWPPSTTRPISLGPKMQLYSKNGVFLAIYRDGKVRGTRDDTDEHTFLERMSGGLLPEEVKFQGIGSQLYVAMDERGRLYGEHNSNLPATVFIESFDGSYNNYLSRHYAHLGWYIGLKKSGKFKKGPKTKFGQKAVKFLPVRSKFE